MMVMTMIQMEPVMWVMTDDDNDGVSDGSDSDPFESMSVKILMVMDVMIVLMV